MTGLHAALAELAKRGPRGFDLSPTLPTQGRDTGWWLDYLSRLNEFWMSALRALLDEHPATPSEGTAYVVPDGPKMLRETLCLAQTLVSDWCRPETSLRHIGRLQRLIDACDCHRPLGPDGKHGDLHTPTCGCDDVPADLPVATDSTTAEIEDGFGGAWPTCGPDCDLQVVRPGKVQCNHTSSTCPDTPASEPTASTMTALIERSSFGTPEAVALRASVSDEVAARVVARAKELEADAPEPSDRVGLSETEKSELVRYLDQYDSHEDVNEVELYAAVERILADRLAVAEQERDEALSKDRRSTRVDTCTHCGDLVISFGGGRWLHYRGPGSLLNRCQHSVPYGKDAAPNKDGRYHPLAEQEAATLRAQVATFAETLDRWLTAPSATRDNGLMLPGDRVTWRVREIRDSEIRAARAALGDPAQVAQRIKDEAVLAELGRAKDAVRDRKRHMASYGASEEHLGALDDAYGVVANLWRDAERARRVRDGEPS